MRRKEADTSSSSLRAEVRSVGRPWPGLLKIRERRFFFFGFVEAGRGALSSSLKSLGLESVAAACRADAALGIGVSEAGGAKRSSNVVSEVPAATSPCAFPSFTSPSRVLAGLVASEVVPDLKRSLSSFSPKSLGGRSTSSISLPNFSPKGVLMVVLRSKLGRSFRSSLDLKEEGSLMDVVAFLPFLPLSSPSPITNTAMVVPMAAPRPTLVNFLLICI